MKKQLLFEFKKFLLKKKTFRITALAVLILMTSQLSFAQQWNILANENTVSSTVTSSTSITMVDEVPYVVYYAGVAGSSGASGSGTGIVKKRNTDGSWSQVGGNIGTAISYTRIYSDPTGKLYITYIEATKLAVATYNTSTSTWDRVGGTGVYVSTGSATNIVSQFMYTSRSSLAFDSTNKPYIAYIEATGLAPTVKKFEGGVWTLVGSTPVNPTTSLAAIAHSVGLVIDESDTPWLSFVSLSGTTSNTGAMALYQFTSGTWTASTALTLPGGIRHTCIGLTSAGNPTIVYFDAAGNTPGPAGLNRATAIEYNKTTNTWGTIFRLGTRDAQNINLVKDTSGNLYCSFIDAYTAAFIQTARIFKQAAGFSTWTELKDPSVLAGTDELSGNQTIAVGSTNPYIVYTKTNSSSIVTPIVRVFDPNKPILTWNGSSWSEAPVATDYYSCILTGPYSTTTNGAFPFKISTLTVNSGGSLTVNTGTNLTILNGVVNNAGVNGIVIENNANLIQLNTITPNTGNVVVNRNSNPLFRLDYTMWSSPVVNQNLTSFSPLTSQSPSRFYTYTSATNTYTAVAAPTTTNFVTGTGYLIRMPNTDPKANYDAGTETLTYPGVFTGVPFNGTKSFTGLTSGLFYAVGNPYPSTISAQSFLAGNTITGGVIYFWRKTNAALGSAYATYTNGGSTTTTPTSAAPNGTIQVGQGFIVKTGAATLTFTNAMRSTNNDNQIFRTKAVEKNRVWLNLTNATGVFSQALVGYIDGATQGVDEGIDGAYINDSPIALTSNINGEEYTIQGRPAFDASDVVALNFKTDVAGDYTIAIDHADGLFAAGQDVYLVDSTTGTETNLKTDAYTFTATTGTAASRFSLKYQKTLGVDAPAFNENNVAVYKNNGTLYVNSGANAISNIKVFDIQGRLIAEQKNVNTTSTSIKNLKGNQQVLIVKVTSQDNKVVNKKVVN